MAGGNAAGQRARAASLMVTPWPGPCAPRSSTRKFLPTRQASRGQPAPPRVVLTALQPMSSNTCSPSRSGRRRARRSRCDRICASSAPTARRSPTALTRSARAASRSAARSARRGSPSWAGSIRRSRSASRCATACARSAPARTSIPTMPRSSTAVRRSTGPWCATTRARIARSGLTTSARWTPRCAPSRQTRRRDDRSCALPSTSTSRGGRSALNAHCRSSRDGCRSAAMPAQLRVGPFVRYADHERAVVWIETVTPCLVRVARSAGRHGGGVVAVRVDGARRRPAFRRGRDRRSGRGPFHDYTVELAPLPSPGRSRSMQGDIQAVFPTLTAAVAASMQRAAARAASLNSTSGSPSARCDATTTASSASPPARAAGIRATRRRTGTARRLGPGHARRPGRVAARPRRRSKLAAVPLLRRRPDLLRRDRRSTTRG